MARRAPGRHLLTAADDRSGKAATWHAADGAFGGTIAHGFLILALITPMCGDILAFPPGVTMLNYGLENVRFPAPTPVGSKIRTTARLASITDTTRGIRLTINATIERENGDKPVCVAELIVFLLGLT